MHVGGVHAVGKQCQSQIRHWIHAHSCIDRTATRRTGARGEARLGSVVEDLNIIVYVLVKTRCVDSLIDSAQFPRTTGAIPYLLGAGTFAHCWARVPVAKVATPTIATVARHVTKPRCLVHALAIARRRWRRTRARFVLVAARDATRTVARVRTIPEGLAGAVHVRPGVSITFGGGLATVGQGCSFDRLCAATTEAETLVA